MMNRCGKSNTNQRKQRQQEVQELRLLKMHRIRRRYLHLEIDWLEDAIESTVKDKIDSGDQNCCYMT